jgi:hypothetical protein
VGFLPAPQSITLDTAAPVISDLTAPGFSKGPVVLTLGGITDAAGLKTLAFGTGDFTPTSLKRPAGVAFTEASSLSAATFTWDPAAHIITLPDHADFRGTYTLEITGDVDGTDGFLRTVSITAAGDQLGVSGNLSLNKSITKDTVAPAIGTLAAGSPFAQGTASYPAVLTLGGISDAAGLRTLQFASDDFIPFSLQSSVPGAVPFTAGTVSADTHEFAWEPSTRTLTLPDHGDFRGAGFVLTISGTLAEIDGSKTIGITAAGDQLDTPVIGLTTTASITKDTTAPLITGVTMENGTTAGPAGYTSGWVKLTVAITEDGSGLTELDVGPLFQQLGNIYVDGSATAHTGAAWEAGKIKFSNRPKPGASLTIYGLLNNAGLSPDSKGIAAVYLNSLTAADGVNLTGASSVSAAISYDTTGPAIATDGTVGGTATNPVNGAPFIITGITVDEDAYGSSGFNYGDSAGYRVVKVTDGSVDKASTDLSGEITFDGSSGTAFDINIYGLEDSSLFNIAPGDVKEITITVGLTNTLGIESLHDWTVEVAELSGIYTYSYAAGGVSPGDNSLATPIPGPAQSIALAPAAPGTRTPGPSGIGGVFNVIRTTAAASARAVGAAARNAASRPRAGTSQTVTPRTGESPAAYYNDPEALRRLYNERTAARTDVIVRRTSANPAPARGTTSPAAAPSASGLPERPPRTPALRVEDPVIDRRDIAVPEPEHDPGLMAENTPGEGSPEPVPTFLPGPGFIPVPSFEPPALPAAAGGENRDGDRGPQANGPHSLYTLPGKAAGQRAPKPRRKYRRS